EAHRHAVVREALCLPQCDRVVTALATAELPSFVDHGRAEDLSARTRKLVAHATAVAETRGDDVCRIDAVVVFDELDHGVGEGQVSSPGVRPPSTEPIRCD